MTLKIDILEEEMKGYWLAKPEAKAMRPATPINRDAIRAKHRLLYLMERHGPTAAINQFLGQRPKDLWPPVPTIWEEPISTEEYRRLHNVADADHHVWIETEHPRAGSRDPHNPGKFATGGGGGSTTGAGASTARSPEAASAALAAIKADVAQRDVGARANAIFTGEDRTYQQVFSTQADVDEVRTALQPSGLQLRTDHVFQTIPVVNPTKLDVRAAHAYARSMDRLKTHGMGSLADYIRKHVPVAVVKLETPYTVMATARFAGDQTLLICDSYDPTRIIELAGRPSSTSRSGRKAIDTVKATGDMNAATDLMFESSACHEFGHVLNALTRGKVASDFAEVVVRESGAYDPYETTPQSYRSLKTQSWLEKNISSYAFTGGYEEGACEAFEMMMMGDPLPSGLEGWGRRVLALNETGGVKLSRGGVELP